MLRGAVESEPGRGSTSCNIRTGGGGGGTCFSPRAPGCVLRPALSMDVKEAPNGVATIEDRILRITGYYGYYPGYSSQKSKTPRGCLALGAERVGCGRCAVRTPAALPAPLTPLSRRRGYPGQKYVRCPRC